VTPRISEAAPIAASMVAFGFAGRIRLKSLLIFLLEWMMFTCFPAAHWIWGDGGWLHVMGVEDFADGIVVHTAADPGSPPDRERHWTRVGKHASPRLAR
jgi:ammonia channel protein AmtB